MAASSPLTPMMLPRLTHQVQLIKLQRSLFFDQSVLCVLLIEGSLISDACDGSAITKRRDYNFPTFLMIH